MTRTRSCAEQAREYLQGLVQAPKKNMEQMSEVVPDADEQALEHFLSQSPWAFEPVIEQVGRDADQLLGGQPESTLVIDESAQTKKGDKSVGGARQWNGRLGKVDNCQVGVYAALNSQAGTTLVDCRLFLPQEWIAAPERCAAAGVPLERAQAHRSKGQLALEMVRQARQRGLRFNWVRADSFYGRDSDFTQGLETDEEQFVVDIPKNRRVYLEDPKPVVPPACGHAPGRRPTGLQAQSPSIRVDQLVASQPNQAWQKLVLRPTTKGPLAVEIFHQRVWLWEEGSQVYHWHLVVRRDPLAQGGYEYTYSLSNAPESTPTLLLAQQQVRRWWVERILEDAKGQAGMGDYQVRGWLGWHHHMTLVMLAMLFLLQERVCHERTHPLLSCRDIMVLLSQLLPRRNVSCEEILRQMEQRHRKRQAAVESANRKAAQTQNTG